MAIRPKEGNKVKMRGWEIRPGDGPTPPSSAWTNVVVSIGQEYTRAIYGVRRDHDGRIVRLLGSDLSYIKEAIPDGKP